MCQELASTVSSYSRKQLSEFYPMFKKKKKKASPEQIIWQEQEASNGAVSPRCWLPAAARVHLQSDQLAWVCQDSQAQHWKSHFLGITVSWKIRTAGHRSASTAFALEWGRWMWRQRTERFRKKQTFIPLLPLPLTVQPGTSHLTPETPSSLLVM